MALALPSNSKAWLERVSKGEPSSLLGLLISDEGKKFYNIDSRRDLAAINIMRGKENQNPGLGKGGIRVRVKVVLQLLKLGHPPAARLDRLRLTTSLIIILLW